MPRYAKHFAHCWFCTVAGSLGLDDEISFLGFKDIVHHSDIC